MRKFLAGGSSSTEGSFWVAARSDCCFPTISSVPEIPEREASKGCDELVSEWSLLTCDLVDEDASGTALASALPVTLPPRRGARGITFFNGVENSSVPFFVHFVVLHIPNGQ